MNNRKQTNKRGVNPRRLKTQIIVEKPKLTILKDGQGLVIDNPRYPNTRIIHHLNN